MVRRLLDPFRLLRTEKPGEEQRKASQKPLIVVGLGNPGPKYRGTRHNVGFLCVDELARRSGATLSNKVRDAEIAETEIAGERAALVKPLTYVNRSGQVARAILRKFNVGPDRLLVVVDDMDLPVGRVRLKLKGGAGGHNGLKSITEQIGSNEYARLRIGIGRPEPGVDPIEHVLGRFRPEEKEAIGAGIQRAADAVESVQTDGFERAMNYHNA
ncbi:MAG: aminoacyl-tRNA hydrolase [Chloroflexota bacterium]